METPEDRDLDGAPEGTADQGRPDVELEDERDEDSDEESESDRPG